MNICIIGTGYVGLVTGSCLADSGNDVTCLDIDKSKIESLKNGEVGIYEPGLEEIVTRNYKEGRLSFTTNYKEAIEFANLVAGISVTREGAANSMPTFDEIEENLE